jgi:hypothetical protein
MFLCRFYAQAIDRQIRFQGAGIADALGCSTYTIRGFYRRNRYFP